MSGFERIGTPVELVKQRLDQAYPVHLHVTEIAQSTGLGRAEIIDALYELEGDGLVEPVEWRAVREAVA